MSYTHSHAGPDFRDFIAHTVRSKRARSYLEVGVRDAATLTVVTCPSIGVDPYFAFSNNPIANKSVLHLYQMTSDEFFRDYDPRAILGSPLDVAFLDGLHQFEYLLRDFMYVEAVSHRETLVMLDDCLPLNSEMTERIHRPELRENKHYASWWTGDVWKLLPILKEYRPDLRVTPLDTTPTGNVCITNLDCASTTLRDHYYEILDKYLKISMDDNYIISFYESLPIKSAREVMRDFESSLTIGP
jgi:hypothetical protein